MSTSEIILITGGCRSGKSGYAQMLAEQKGGNKVYIATAPVFDDEMRNRVERHKLDRAGRSWETVEEQCDLAGLADLLYAKKENYSVILIDCLTLWVNNLMYHAEQNGAPLNEDEVASKSLQMVQQFAKLGLPVIFVTNETGMGIVPDNAQSRQFRDLAGRCNQTVAQAASKVVLMVCGQPLIVKNLLAKI